MLPPLGGLNPSSCHCRFLSVCHCQFQITLRGTKVIASLGGLDPCKLSLFLSVCHCQFRITLWGTKVIASLGGLDPCKLSLYTYFVYHCQFQCNCPFSCLTPLQTVTLWGTRVIASLVWPLSDFHLANSCGNGTYGISWMYVSRFPHRGPTNTAMKSDNCV
jgi:hypothetical protein